MPIAKRRPNWYLAAEALTPVEEHGGYLVKRDDLAEERGVRGGKARVLGVICRHIEAVGMRGLTTHTSRYSVTPEALGAVCCAYGIAACVHTAASAEPMSEAFKNAVRYGVRVVEHRPGYMSVLASRAKKQAEEDGYMEVGLGLSFPAATVEIAKQVDNLPRNIKRLVTSVGSGRQLEGIIMGLERIGFDIPVLGVCVGSIPDCIVNLETPLQVELRKIATPYGRPAKVSRLGNLELNPYYAAKCIEYLLPDDLLWVVAK